MNEFISFFSRFALSLAKILQIIITQLVGNDFCPIFFENGYLLLKFGI